MGSVGEASTGLLGRLGAVGGSVLAVTGRVATLATGLGAGLIAAQAFREGLHAFGDATVGLNAKLQTAQLQFETLLGSADAAREHVRSLFEFAATTPFETGPIIEASRTLLTFGIEAGKIPEMLTLVGNAAAITGTGIQDIAFWFGRAISAIQAGRPFGEAAQRLQELGILTPTARNELQTLSEQLKKTGPDAALVGQTISVLTGQFQRFDGAMAKQAQTWEGLTSTIRDNLQLGLADAFAPMFESLRESLSGLAAIVQSPEFQQGLKTFGSGLQSVFSVIGMLGQPLLELAKVVWPLFVEVVTLAATVLAPLVSALGLVSQALVALIGLIQPAIVAVKDFVALIRDSATKIMTTFADGIRSGATAVYDAIKEVLGRVRNFLPFSPAKEGPLADLDIAGQQIPGTLADGVRSGSGLLIDAITDTLTDVEDLVRGSARAIHTAFSDSFVALMHGDLDSLEDAWGAFLDAILRQVANFLASAVIQQLLGLGSSLVSSLTGGAINLGGLVNAVSGSGVGSGGGGSIGAAGTAGTAASLAGSALKLFGIDIGSISSMISSWTTTTAVVGDAFAVAGTSAAEAAAGIGSLSTAVSQATSATASAASAAATGASSFSAVAAAAGPVLLGLTTVALGLEDLFSGNADFEASVLGLTQVILTTRDNIMSANIPLEQFPAAITMVSDLIQQMPQIFQDGALTGDAVRVLEDTFGEQAGLIIAAIHEVTQGTLSLGSQLVDSIMQGAQVTVAELEPIFRDGNEMAHVNADVIRQAIDAQVQWLSSLPGIEQFSGAAIVELAELIVSVGQNTELADQIRLAILEDLTTTVAEGSGSIVGAVDALQGPLGEIAAKEFSPDVIVNVTGITAPTIESTFQHGAFVTRARRAVVGEGGPEAVLPNPFTAGSSGRRFAQDFARAIAEALPSNGSPIILNVDGRRFAEFVVGRPRRAAGAVLA